MPNQWAKTQHNLGLSLATLGKVEGSNEDLRQAIAAYSSALEIRTRELTPVAWAFSTGEMGKAKALLAFREHSRPEMLEAREHIETAFQFFSSHSSPGNAEDYEIVRASIDETLAIWDAERANPPKTAD